MIRLIVNKSINKHTILHPLLLIALCVMVMPGTIYAGQKKVIGWLEYVKINGDDLRLEAKIDTGADSSSINARILSSHVVNNENWIRFQLINNKNHKVILEQKVIRYIKVKRRRASSIKRPVVKLGICLGYVYRQIEVNLADRGNFKYPMLIGRDYLNGIYIVDVELQHSTNPDCRHK